LIRKTVTSRRWKKAAAFYCALVLRPDLDRRGLKNLAQAILDLGRNEASEAPRTQINEAQVYEAVWANSQCVLAARHRCPLLIFGRHLADELNQFFSADGK
jgi:hypothetical protein